MAVQFQQAQNVPQINGLNLNDLLQLLNQLEQSQQAQQGNYNPLTAGQLGAYTQYPMAMNQAMNQMWGVNQANQNAKLFNNNLNAQLGQAGILGQSNALQALYNAQAQLGVADLQRRAQTDMFSNPLFQEYIRGNLGTAIADAQGKNALAQIQAKGGIAKDLFGSMAGLFGGALGGGVGGGAAGILQGFQSADGTQGAALPGASLPAAGGNYSPASPASQPAATQQEQPGAMQPYLQQISARGGVQPWRPYLADIMAQRRG